MKIFELLRNPIIKLIGVVIILYFALFANKEYPNSLGNRWSSEQLKKDLDDAKIKSRFIVSNVKAAQEAAKEKAALSPEENAKKISIEDVEEGDGEEKISCGDAVQISYAVYTQDNRQLQFVDSETFAIGAKNNQLIEQNIIGMKHAGTRYIKVASDFQTSDKKLSELLKFQASDLKYQITVLSITKNASPQISCE